MQGPKGTQAELSGQIGSKRTKWERVFQRKAKQVPRLGGLRARHSRAWDGQWPALARSVKSAFSKLVRLWNCLFHKSY